MARQDGNEYFILEAMSQGFLKNYRLKEALICLQRMLALQPDSNFALRRRAWICVKSGQFDQAEKDYRQALEVDPADVVARQELAQILLDIRKNAKEAAEHFERIAAERRDSQSVMGLAKSWRTLGRNEDARTMLEAWLKDNPRDALALMERGKLALDEQEQAQATVYLRKAVEVSPYLLDANQGLYVCLTELGLTEEAEACQTRIKQARQDNEQLVSLSQKLQAKPDDLDLRCQMAEIFLRQGEEDEGLRWLQTNLQSNPSHRATHLALATFYEKRGQQGQAAEHRSMADGKLTK
jgi:Flp pilus assembly protein TadD